MDGRVYDPKPGAGLTATPEGESQPVGVPFLGDATATLFYGGLIGGQPGRGKTHLANILAVYEVVRADASTCRACPAGCGSCTRDESDCECYEHQGCHPDNVRPTGGEAV